MRRYAVFAVVAAGAIAGCGGSSLSDRQLHSQATRVCSLAAAQTDRIATPSTPAASVTYLDRGLTALQPELLGLQKLHPPSDVGDVYAATVKTLSQKLAYMEDTARRMRKGADPVSALRALQQKIGPLESQENGGWQALELPACLSR
jgi:hypothetical protein